MVKTPKTRHSKPKREPVTIDLDPASVSRVNDPGQGEGTSEKGKSEQSGKTGSQTGAKASDTGKKDTGKEESSKASASAASSAGAASSATGAKPSAAATKPASGYTSSAAARPREDASGKDKSAGAAGKENTGAKAGTGGPTGPSTGERATPATPPPQRRSGPGAAFAAGILGGIVALVLAGALQWAGAIPAIRPAGEDTGQSVETLRQDVDSLRSDVAALQESGGSAGSAGDEVTQRLDALEGAVDGIKNTLGDLQSSVSSGGAGENAGLDALETRLADLEKQVSGLSEGQNGGDGEAVQDRLSELGQTARSASGAASQNSERLQSLDDRVAALDKRVESNDRQPRLALVMAASALKSAVERGGPFASELETYATVAKDSEGLDELRSYADTGVPTRAEIEAEAGDAASRMIDATDTTDADGGVLDRLMASARSLVTVRPVGEVEGDGVGATAARIERAARNGDYDKALQEYDTLPEEAKAAASGFADMLRARRAAERIVDRALSAALKSA